MGERGPIPKRSDERIRRNKDDVPLEKVTAVGVVQTPELNIDNPHPMVTDFYDSLKESAQSKFYEPSDWQLARIGCLLLDEAFKVTTKGGISAMKIANIMSIFSDLLVSEGDRRRVRMEVERQEAAGTVVDLAEMFKNRFSS